LTGVRVRSTFLYRVKKGEEKIDGEQKAFTKQEVQDALSKMGYQRANPCRGAAAAS